MDTYNKESKRGGRPSFGKEKNTRKTFGGSRNRSEGGSRQAFGGRPAFSSGRPAFGGERGGYDRPQLHKAVCAECNKTCEVPFRPTGEKPVYCQDCFGGRAGGDRGASFKKPYAPAPKPSAPVVEMYHIDGIKKQLQTLENKLVELVGTLEKIGASAAEQPSFLEQKKQNKIRKQEIKGAPRTTDTTAPKKVTKKVVGKKVVAKKSVAKKVAKK